MRGAAFKRVLPPVAVALISHATVLLGGFAWLDHGDLEQGAAIAPASEWLSLFAHGFARTGFYRPLMALSLSIDSLAGAPWVYHADNLLWHAAAAAMVTLAGEALGLSRRVALVGGMLFAAHPVTALVVGAISYRADALIAVALLGLLVAHLEGRPLWAGLALFTGGLCKETALVLGPAFIVLNVLLDARKAPTRGRVRLFAAEGAGWALALGLRLAFAPRWKASWPDLSAGEAVGSRLAAAAKSFGRLVAPIDQTICDAFPVTPLLHPVALLGLLAIAAVAGFALWRRGPALYLAVSLVPSLDLVPAPRFWSPHYLYLPLAFAALLAAEQWERAGRVRVPLGGALLAGAMAVSIGVGLRYRNDEALFGPEVAAQPRCREAQLYLGDARRKAADWEEAAAHYELAAAPAPGLISYSDVASAYQNLGLVRMKQHRLDDAEAAMRRTLEFPRPELDQRKAVHNLAALEMTRGNKEEAARLLEPETARADAFPESLYLRARALTELGRDAEAAPLIKRLIQPGR